MPSNSFDEKNIHDFWNAHPCGEQFASRYDADYVRFFESYDAWRYKQEAHILKRLDAIDFRDKKVLEIGLGQGADAEQLIKRGALWSGLDLTPESVSRVGRRMELHHLPFQALKVGSALDIPYEDGSFDIVFSHGVLHHIPDIRQAQQEIARVLKPGGELIAMFYAKRSVNYLLSIAIVRRLALLGAYFSPVKPQNALLQGHLQNVKKTGIWDYLRMENFVHRNTDGPGNPYAKVYDLNTVRADFPNFEISRSYQDYMHAPPLPVHWMKPLAGSLGWHLWVHLRKREVFERQEAEQLQSTHV
jgi:ubiquinone/menaquinone biosynthesis C-methylase UbiE